MRINKFVALATGMSRRGADAAVNEGRVTINGQAPEVGQLVKETDSVALDNRSITTPVKTQTVVFNKPAGYVCSRSGQGSKTIYDLLPAELHNLKPVGRLDKNSSGLLLLTNNGELAHKLTHPSFQKEKVYEVELDRPLDETDKHNIELGVQLEDGLSKLGLSGSGKSWIVKMSEGRNRQIRRTFKAMDYEVQRLNRVRFGSYSLGDLAPGSCKEL